MLKIRLFTILAFFGTSSSVMAMRRPLRPGGGARLMPEWGPCFDNPLSRLTANDHGRVFNKSDEITCQVVGQILTEWLGLCGPLVAVSQEFDFSPAKFNKTAKYMINLIFPQQSVLNITKGAPVGSIEACGMPFYAQRRMVTRKLILVVQEIGHEAFNAIKRHLESNPQDIDRNELLFFVGMRAVRTSGLLEKVVLGHSCVIEVQDL